ncbi:hypothetical protein CR983_01675 [Candidatus Saccharibacteria bacterium]|nr:MAG: hypothetical protein CR983_01675 [Candidatus Saccharibacteria bacterium]
MNDFWHQLPQPFFVLAPMEAVTDVVFRQVVAEAAAPDVWFSEFTNATGWVHAGQKAIGGRLVKTNAEHPIVAQIWGGEPGDMEQLATHCAQLGFDGIDINMGCPAKSAIKSGGSALIRQPELAAAAIASAKTAGLPVSVKTRLGYTHVDEWHNWLAHLLRQDIINLTIHLRTKKEMSKVPAHFELIDDIVALRDEIAPHTLITINGDITDRAHGEELATKNPGINGIMIGRGIFHDPFCFARKTASTRAATDNRQSSGYSAFPAEVGQDELVVGDRPYTSGLMGGDGGEAAGPARVTSEQPSHPEGSAFPAERGQEDSNWRPRVPEGGDEREEGRGNEADPTRAASDNHDTDEHSAFPASVGQDKLVISDRPYARGVMGGDSGEAAEPTRAATDNRQSSGYSAFPAERGQEDGNWRPRVPEGSDGSEEGRGGEAIDKKHQLLHLLNRHLDLYDQWSDQTGRPYDTLKRFFKIYIRDFDGAKDIRDQLMHTSSTAEARQVIRHLAADNHA